MFSAVSVVNTALEFIASQTLITSLTDGTPAANAANIIYAPVVQLLLREIAPDFARTRGGLNDAGAPFPQPPWLFEYIYPVNCLRLLQVGPAIGSYNLFDPQPVASAVAFDVISSVATKVILTNQANAAAVFITAAVTESQWDAAFAEAVARRLANPLAMALSGRPDFAKELLGEAASMAETSENVDDSSISTISRPQ